jgi:hypothetical protein
MSVRRVQSYLMTATQEQAFMTHMSLLKSSEKDHKHDAINRHGRNP